MPPVFTVRRRPGWAENTIDAIIRRIIMLHSVKTRLFAAALCGAMLLTTACGGSAAGGTGPAAASGAGNASTASSGTAGTGETDGPKYGGTLTTYTSADPKSFDPAALSAWDQTIVAANILEGLVRLNPEGNAIEPGIAKSWEPSEDGTVWTFHLRDAKFHNGRVGRRPCHPCRYSPRPPEAHRSCQSRPSVCRCLVILMLKASPAPQVCRRELLSVFSELH